MAQYQQNQYPIQPDMAYQPPVNMTDKTSSVPPYQQHDHEQYRHGSNGGGGGSGALSKWSFGMFDCFSPLSTCCIASWCPCYLFGKTYQRNKTGEKSPSGFNVMCASYCLTFTCGFAPCLQTITRGNARQQYDIEGNMCVDFCASLWCGCCTLIQEDKESIVRRNAVDPRTGAVWEYRKVGGMEYN